MFWSRIIGQKKRKKSSNGGLFFISYIDYDLQLLLGSMIKELTITELIDSSNGFLKARLYTYLSQKYVHVDMEYDEIVKDVLGVFNTEEVIPLVKEWTVRR